MTELQPTEIDLETEKLIRERLATAEDEPRQDAHEAIEEIRLKLKRPLSR